MVLQKTFGPVLIVLLLLGLLIIQVSSLFVVVGTIVNYIYTVVAYVTIAGLLWLERDHLNDFHIDRFTLILMILSSLFRTRLGVTGEGYFLLIIGLSGVTIAILLFRYGSLIQSSNRHWLLVAVGVSCVLLVPIAILEAPRFQTGATSSEFPTRIIPFILHQTVLQLSFTSLIEEFIFRGFVWGYLERLGWPSNRAMWVQGLIFWLFHFPQAGAIMHFFLAIPLATIIDTVLTRKSKQLGPAVVSHTIINAMAPLISTMFHF